MEMLKQATKNEIAKLMAEALRIEGEVRGLNKLLEHLEINGGVGEKPCPAPASGPEQLTLPFAAPKVGRAKRKRSDNGSGNEKGSSEGGAL
jgi:hypothetical protein